MPYTVNIWFNADDVNGQQCLFGTFDSSTTSERHMLVIEHIGSTAAGDEIACVSSNAAAWSAAFTTTQHVASTWQMATGVWGSDTDRRAFLDGGGKGTDATESILAGTQDTTAIGMMRDSTPNWAFDGQLAECAIWNVALTDAEIAMLYQGGTAMHPGMIRPSALIHYWPIYGITDPEMDLVGGKGLALAATPLKAEHPQVYRPGTQIFRGLGSVASAGDIYVPGLPQRIVRHTGWY